MKKQIAAQAGEDILSIIASIKSRTGIKKTSDVILYCLREVAEKEQSEITAINAVDMRNTKMVSIMNSNLTISDGTGHVTLKNCSNLFLADVLRNKDNICK